MSGSSSSNLLLDSRTKPRKPELILPALAVIVWGLMFDENPESYEVAREYLFKDDGLVAVINRGRKSVGVLVENSNDFDNVSLEGFEAMYIVEGSLADQARTAF